MSDTWGAPVPSWHGHRAPEIVDAAGRGEIDFLYSIGGNLLATMPDPNYVAMAMSRVRLRIHQDVVINTSALLEPGETVLLLPAQTRYEHAGGVTSTNTERRIRFSPEIPGPRIAEAKAEWEIPALVARRAPRARAGAHLSQHQGNPRGDCKGGSHLSRDREAREAGEWVQWGGPMLCSNGRFDGMPGERAAFRKVVSPRVEVPAGKFYLSSRRGKQFNSMTFGTTDPLTGSRSRDEIFVSEADAARLALRRGDPVVLRSETGTMRGRARIADVKVGNLVAQWPECNVLIARRVDPISGEPDYNAVVSLEKG